MLDKKTPRCQNFKNYQLQQHQQSFSKCDALPQPFFDFALADPLPAHIYELLKATYLYLAATKSPICSTLLSAMLQFEQYAAISSTTLASVVSCSIKYQLELQGSLISTKLTTVASSDFLDAPSTFQLPSVSSSPTINDVITSLLDFSASQLESQCALLEQQIQLCEQFHSIKEQFSICEAHNLHLDAKLARLTAVHSPLVSDLSRLQTENDHTNTKCDRLTAANSTLMSDLSRLQEENARAIAKSSSLSQYHVDSHRNLSQPFYPPYPVQDPWTNPDEIRAAGMGYIYTTKDYG